MTTEQLETLAAMHAAACGVLSRRTPTPQESVVYIEALSDLPFAAVSQALEQLLRASRNMPAPFEVREVAARFVHAEPHLALPPPPEERRNRKLSLEALIATVARDGDALERIIGEMQDLDRIDRAEWMRILQRTRANRSKLGEKPRREAEKIVRLLTR